METKKTALQMFYFAIEVIIYGQGKVNFILTLFTTTWPLSFPYFLFILGFVPDEYKSIDDRRLTNVFKTVITSSTFQCTTWCSMTDGCLAVKVIGNHDITCELTTGLSNETEMEDAYNSKLVVLGKLFGNFFDSLPQLFLFDSPRVTFNIALSSPQYSLRKHQ